MLGACTDIFTTLAEVVNERPGVRAGIHSIKMQLQSQVPGASAKENMSTQSASVPVIPGRAAARHCQVHMTIALRITVGQLHSL